LPQELRDCRGVRVAEVMIPWDELAIVSHGSLQYLNVYEVRQMLQRAAFVHVVVVDNGDDAPIVARGLISWGALENRLQELNCMNAD